jgi:hypothetical protein
MPRVPPSLDGHVTSMDGALIIERWEGLARPSDAVLLRAHAGCLIVVRRKMGETKRQNAWKAWGSCGEVSDPSRWAYAGQSSTIWK